jgi:UDP-N-acetylmuramoyl-L-alanyl-D-glutamate--2,6-diaminopimelate ligase
VENIAYDSPASKETAYSCGAARRKVDSHDFIQQAIEKGATAIVAERAENHPRATCVVVENARYALADLAASFYGFPARRLKLAVVTGTNGKTPTTFLIKHICDKASLRCGLIGTVRYEIGERVLPAIRTTPESADLPALLAQIVNAGGKAAAMEVSSHALAQERTRGLEWDVAVFTNLTQDHLDFHSTMENYFESKLKLFTQLAGQRHKRKPVAVVNIDDHGEKLLTRIDKKISVVTYGLSARADFRASNYRAEFGATSYQLDARGKSYLVRVPLIGRFNVANSLAALAASNALGVSLREAILVLAVARVPGRLGCRRNANFSLRGLRSYPGCPANVLRLRELLRVA